MLLTAIHTCVVGNPGVEHKGGSVFEVSAQDGAFLLSVGAAREPSEEELALHERFNPAPKPAAKAGKTKTAEAEDDGV
jgi:hypothetical protein